MLYLDNWRSLFVLCSWVREKQHTLDGAKGILVEIRVYNLLRLARGMWHEPARAAFDWNTF